jgi:Uma2 family endonuclease
MAEPARQPHPEPLDDDEGIVMLQRVIEHPDGRLELMEIPLTLEDYLDPQLDDKMTQGETHARWILRLGELLTEYFEPQPDVIVLADVKIIYGKGFGPSPDVSIIRGARPGDRDSFDVRKEGIGPCLVIEVVSPKDRRVRHMDEHAKLVRYERYGVPEYLLVYPPGKITGPRCRLVGHRLASDGRYHPIKPDAAGRLLSETTGLRFGVSPADDRVEVFEDRTGERILYGSEVREAHRLSEAARQTERAAREAAERELKRLRAEIEQLKKSKSRQRRR